MTESNPRLAAYPKLTARENEVLKWLAQGIESKEIAKQIDVSVFTVNAHLQSIYGKCKVCNSVEALRVVAGLLAGGRDKPLREKAKRLLIRRVSQPAWSCRRPSPWPIAPWQQQQ